MTDQIALDFDTGRQHAARVGTVIDGVRLAENAASSLNLGGGAFGVMCSFLVTPATLISDVAIGTISSAAAMLERAQTELRGMVADFEEQEQDFAGRYRQIQGQLDGAPQ